MFRGVTIDAVLVTFAFVRSGEDRHTVIWRGVRVAADERREARGRAAEPAAASLAEQAAESVPTTADSQSVLYGDATADDLHRGADLSVLREGGFAFMLRPFGLARL